MNIEDFYEQAQRFVQADPAHAYSVRWQKSVTFEDQTPESFFSEYCWVVLVSGFKVAIARKFNNAFIKSGERPEDRDVELLYKNERKKEAIREAQRKYREWFFRLKEAKNKVVYLDTLPFIGPVTRYHLAKNLGIDTIKPDVHLSRLADQFGYKDAFKMCDHLSETKHEKKLVIDIILWMYCAENPSYKNGNSRI